MRLSCFQENLSRGLGIVGRAVANRATLPITQNVLLSTDQSMLKLSATNLEIAMTTWIGASIEGEGTVTVPARLLTEFVNSLPNGRIDMELQPGTSVLQLRCGNSQANIHGADASDFPPIPTVEDGMAANVDPAALRLAISRVAFAAATEESRPVLTGVELKLSGEKFTMAAADGFRLAVLHGELLQAVEGEIKVIVPARTLNEISRLLTDQEEPVEIVMTPAKGQVLFRLNGSQTVETVSQLLQGAFPNYDQLIPQSYETRATFDSATFLRAARTASIFARDDVRTEISIDLPDPAYDRPTWPEERATFGARLAAGYQLEEHVAVEFAGWILEASTRQSLAPELLASLVMTESSFRKDVRSSVGAIGPTQVQPLLWDEYCSVDLKNPEENIYCGAQILAYYRERCATALTTSEDAQSCALRAYNVGYRNRNNVYFLPAANRYVAKINRHLAPLTNT